MKFLRSFFYVLWLPLMCAAVLGGSLACGPGGPPDPPSDIATNVDVNVDGIIVLNWTLSQDLKDRVTKFIVYRDERTDGDFTSKVAEINQAEGTLDEPNRIYKYSFTDNNTIKGGQYEIPYYYRITSVGQDGKEGKPSNTITAKTANFDPPALIENIKVTGGNIYDDIEQKPDPKIIITWKAGTDNDLEGYYVFRSASDSPISTADVSKAHSKLILHKPGQTEVSWADQLKEEEIGKPYWYTVVGVDKGNLVGRNKPSNRLLGIALQSATLQNPQKGSQTSKPVFKWDAVDSALAYVVVLQKSTRGDEEWRSPVLNKDTTEVTLPNSVNLTSGLKYYWYVTAYAETPTNNETNGNSTSPLWNFTVSADD